MKNIDLEMNFKQELMGITMEEIKKALAKSKRGKASRPGHIPV